MNKDSMKYAVVRRSALETGGSVFNNVEAYLLYTQYKQHSGNTYSEWKRRFFEIEGYESLASTVKEDIWNCRSKKSLLGCMYKAITDTTPQRNVEEVAAERPKINTNIKLWDIHKLLQLRAYISEATTGLLDKKVDGVEVEVEAFQEMESAKADYYLTNESIEVNEHLNTQLLVYRDPMLTNTFAVTDASDLPVRIYIQVNKEARELDTEHNGVQNYYISAYVQLQDGNVRIVRVGNVVYNTNTHTFDFNIMQYQLFSDVQCISDIVSLLVTSKAWEDVREVVMLGAHSNSPDVYTIKDIEAGILVG